MRLLRLPALTALFLVVSAAAAPAQLEPESYAVYSVVVDSLRARGLDSLWVDGRALTLTPASGWRRGLEANADLSAALVDDLLARGAAAHALDSGWTAGVSTVGPSPLDDRVVSSRWRVILSPVGFTPDRTEALLYVAQECGQRCGALSYVWLKKDGDAWRLARWVPQARY